MASPRKTPEASEALELRGARRARGRTILPLVLVATWLLGGVPAALAAAGGGSSGAGGGGSGFGGGGSGFGGGSGGSGGDGSASAPSWWVIVCLLAVSVYVAVRFGWPRVRSWQRRRVRLGVIELAAAEAAEDDPVFAPVRVRSDAASLFIAIQAAWDARDVERLGQLVGPDLLAEWTRRLDDFARKGWHNRVAVDPERVKIDYVGLINQTGEREDRVVVHVQAAISDYVETDTGRVIPYAGSTVLLTRTLSEFWTLGKRDGHWIVISIEGAREGEYHLTEPLVPLPSDDTQLLHDEAVAEQAANQTPTFAPAEIADLDFAGSARAAALDLALADERFDPDLIEASVRRILAAWASAIDGDDSPLQALARPEAVSTLLYAGDAERRTRLVVRNPCIRTVRITAIDPAAQPPNLSIVIEGSAVRYIEDRATAAVLFGDPDTERHVRLTWILALEAPPPWPWRLATVATSAQNRSPARRREHTAPTASRRDRDWTHH
jgi:predicted lipid-binding transport protein (Tim44 family)